MTCRCGCNTEARWLITGKAYAGYWYSEDPVCDAFSRYCMEAAHELDLPFDRVPVQANGDQ